MIQFDDAQIFVARQLLGQLSVTGPEQARILVSADNCLKRGKKIEEKETEEKENGGSEKEI